MSTPIPDPAQRWRCGGCGNLTRFDVRRTRRTTEFWHFDLAGGHAVEETEVEAETVESVTCRWCGRDDAVEVVARADVGADVAADVAAGVDAEHPGRPGTAAAQP
ncbi:hypothetical protein [Nocardioides sp. SYSU D00038]|uniref:hypothetical protein n=1 Tax=Nocardioides sp. SYSU D00038 TaxID=2812554 RepID=UPI001F07E095|nr:hypothetical protein [Nocardioides sp. SYSU D00038]